jgi:hypothetical protein
VTGERLGPAGGLGPSRARNERTGAKEAEFTSSSGGVRKPSAMRAGTARRGVTRNHSEPSQVIEAGFRASVNCSYPEGKWLLLQASTERTTLAAPPKGSAQRNPPKGGTKGASSPGRAHGRGRPGESFRNAGDSKNGTAGL